MARYVPTARLIPIVPYGLLARRDPDLAPEAFAPYHTNLTCQWGWQTIFGPVCLKRSKNNKVLFPNGFLHYYPQIIKE